MPNTDSDRCRELKAEIEQLRRLRDNSRDTGPLEGGPGGGADSSRPSEADQALVRRLKVLEDNYARECPLPGSPGHQRMTVTPYTRVPW